MRETVEFDLRNLFKILLKRSWIIFLCMVVMGAAMFVYTVNFVTPQYKANVTMYVNNNTSNNGTGIDSTDLAVALRLVKTYVTIISSDNVLDKVISETELDLTAEQVRSMLSAEVVNETEMFRVSVTAPSPQLAADIANAIAEVAPDEITAIIEGSAAKVIDYAKVPKGRSSPNYTTNTAIGALIGAVLSVLAILIHNMLDLTVHNEDELTNTFSIPVLGVIPELQEDKKQSFKKVRR